MSKVHPELIDEAKEEVKQSERVTTLLKAARQEAEQRVRLRITSRSELRRKFLTALRSGDYEQAIKSLRSLGPKQFRVVAKMPSYKDSIKNPFTPITTYVEEIEQKHKFCAIGLAYEIMGGDWSKPGPYIYGMVRHTYGLRINDIIKLNDNGHSFKEIADKLERCPWWYWENSVYE